MSLSDVAVRADGLTRRFGDVWALTGIDLEVRTGETLGLVGPNGAGKTTFVRMVAGLLAPTAGHLEVLGRTPGRRIADRIGYMTQSPALYDDLTVGENLEFFGRIYGLSAAGTAERSAELLELLHIGGKVNAPVRTLSGGQRQLANLAASMVHDPKLLLLDEPTVGIDPVLRVELWTYFASLHDAGTTILVTTHVLDEAERCTRVAFISRGRAIAVGSPSELRERAGTQTLESAFVALREPEDP